MKKPLKNRANYIPSTLNTVASTNLQDQFGKIIIANQFMMIVPTFSINVAPVGPLYPGPMILHF